MIMSASNGEVQAWELSREEKTECVCEEESKQTNKQTNIAQLKIILKKIIQKKTKQANLPSLSLIRGAAELGLYLHWPRQQT